MRHRSQWLVLRRKMALTKDDPLADQLVYSVPGGSAPIQDFKSMCTWYMETFFPNWLSEQGPKGVHLVPPLPQSIPPEPPEGSSGGQKTNQVGIKQYRSFRTGQKTQIDEYKFVLKLQKFAIEKGLPMFIFHGFHINTNQWKLIKSVVKTEIQSSECLTELQNSFQIDSRGSTKNLEIDVITIDPINGVMLCELKSHGFETKSTESDFSKITAAAKQLQRDELFISWIANYFTSDKIEPVMKKFVVLPDDEISADMNAKFASLRNSYDILDKSILSNWNDFLQWFGSLTNKQVESSEQPIDLTCKYLVPVLVGLAVTSIIEGKIAGPVHNYKEKLSHSVAVRNLDSKIFQENLTKNKKTLFTDVEPTGKSSIYNTCGSLKIQFLTPRQQEILNSSNRGTKLIIGPAGSGKTILTTHKLLQFCKNEPEEKILLLCDGNYTHFFKKILSENEVICSMLVQDDCKYQFDHPSPIDSAKSQYNAKFFQVSLAAVRSGTEEGPKKDEYVVHIALNLEEVGNNQVIIADVDIFLKCTTCSLPQQDDNFWFYFDTHVMSDDNGLRMLSELPPGSDRLESDHFLRWCLVDQAQNLRWSNLTDRRRRPQTASNYLHIEHIKKMIDSPKVEKFVLEEVLRNTVQIHQFTRCIRIDRAVHYIARLEQQFGGTVSSSTHFPDAKQGSNFNGTPVRIYQLFDKNTVPGLTPIHRKCLSYNSMQQKPLSYNSTHQMYGENACHTIFIHFRKTIETKLNHFCGFLRTVEQTVDKKKQILIFFEKSAYHTISIYDTKIFENFPQNIFFCFFFKRKSNLVRKQTFFERIFLHACKI